MSTEHSITPPPELVEQWCTAPTPPGTDCLTTHLATQAARWGADQELEACVEWVKYTHADDTTPGALRAARRPKPPSLKQLALKSLDAMADCMSASFVPMRRDLDTIRRVLESLPD